jgi:hypothetical protein
MEDRPPRLGDVIDDYCPRCRLLLNHDVASLYQDAVAKVTCRTCHNTHDYRHGQLPARRRTARTKDKEVKSLFDQVLAGLPPPPEPPRPPAVPQRKRRDLWAEVERLNKKK